MSSSQFILIINKYVNIILSTRSVVLIRILVVCNITLKIISQLIGMALMIYKKLKNDNFIV